MKYLSVASAGLSGALVAAAMLVAPTSLEAQTHPKLNDAQIAHVAVTANAIDVDVAKIALSRTKNAEVKKFAETMQRDHSAVIDAAAALAGKLGVTPADNDLSKSLMTDAKGVETSLNKLNGAAFDKAYIDREVAYHEAVIGALDGVLVPQLQNAELKKFLVDARPAFVAHLDHAKMIQQALAK